MQWTKTSHGLSTGTAISSADDTSTRR